MLRDIQIFSPKLRYMIEKEMKLRQRELLLDVLGCTRATMTNAMCWFIMRMLTKLSNYGVIGIEHCYYFSLISNV